MLQRSIPLRFEALIKMRQKERSVAYLNLMRDFSNIRHLPTVPTAVATGTEKLQTWSSDLDHYIKRKRKNEYSVDFLAPDVRLVEYSPPFCCSNQCSHWNGKPRVRCSLRSGPYLHFEITRYWKTSRPCLENSDGSQRNSAPRSCDGRISSAHSGR